MTEQELRELKIKTLEAYGYSLEKDNNGVDEFYRLWDSKGQRYLGVNFDSRTEAWDAAPDVTRSLDACAPLIKEIENCLTVASEDSAFRIISNSKSVTVTASRAAMYLASWTEIYALHESRAAAKACAVCQVYSNLKSDGSLTKGEEQ